jgi:hypothetical protein
MLKISIAVMILIFLSLFAKYEEKKKIEKIEKNVESKKTL